MALTWCSEGKLIENQAEAQREAMTRDRKIRRRGCRKSFVLLPVLPGRTTWGHLVHICPHDGPASLVHSPSPTCMHATVCLWRSEDDLSVDPPSTLLEAESL